uniref:Uncharacterized protein n=1 Tax=Micrurus lemniscatus lemniscatus TaxID=129467 RepID=A0A2D4J3S8_MICLE
MLATTSRKAWKSSILQIRDLDVKLPILFLEVPCLKPREVTSNGCSGTALQLIAGKWGERLLSKKQWLSLLLQNNSFRLMTIQYDFAFTVQEISYFTSFSRSPFPQLLQC